MNRSRMLLKACFLVALVAAANNDDYTCAASPGGCAGKSEADSSTLLQSRARIEDEESQPSFLDEKGDLQEKDEKRTKGEKGKKDEEETKTKVEAKPRPQATCEQPSTTTGYNFDNAAGTTTIDGFAPTGVACASGYYSGTALHPDVSFTGTVTYTVCTSAGEDYSVSGCEASPIVGSVGDTTCPLGYEYITTSAACDDARNKLSIAGSDGNDFDDAKKCVTGAKLICKAVTGMCAGNAMAGPSLSAWDWQNDKPVPSMSQWRPSNGNWQKPSAWDVQCRDGFDDDEAYTYGSRNKGSTATGTTPSDCCEPMIMMNLWGTGDSDYDARTGRITKSRMLYSKFKRCTDGSCKDCAEDTGCGWDRTTRINNAAEPFVLTLSAGDHDEHVAEFWADCAEGVGAKWNVVTRFMVCQPNSDAVLNIQSCDPSDASTKYTNMAIDLFGNANTRVFLAEEGGHMKGEEQSKTMERARQEEWKGTENGLPIASGSTRLYVVIKARDVKKGVKVMLDVRIDNPPGAVADCMDNKMCLKKIDPSVAGTILRNNNAVQLLCLKGESLFAFEPPPPQSCDLRCECLKWKDCLTPVQADGLLVLLGAAAVGSQKSTDKKSRKLLQKSSASTVISNNPSGAVSGACVDPASDDPESWDCECHGAVYAACKVVTGGCIDDCKMLPSCILGLMCDSTEVCPEWKVDRGCPCATDPACATNPANCCLPASFLLSTDNVSMQDHGHSLAERSTNGLEDTKHTDSGTSLDETLSDKCA